LANVTSADIVSGIRAAGVMPGCNLLVHSSLSSFGYVEGGANAVIDALIEAVGADGTVLVPTLTGNETLSPANPPVFDPVNTPCWTGRIPETFRQRPDAVRSLHPTHSVAAMGANARRLTQDHELSITPCDEYSPYGKLAQDANSLILLVGVDHESNTMFHHVEEVVGTDYHMQAGFAEATLLIGGEEIRRRYMLHRYGTPRDFNVMEDVFIERGIQKTFHIGASTLRLIRAKDMVAFTIRCVRANPSLLCQV
jgi:aminoglycoside 3-N-acetyltransferase